MFPSPNELTNQKFEIVAECKLEWRQTISRESCLFSNCFSGKSFVILRKTEDAQFVS